jgi:hypothetical protein
VWLGANSNQWLRGYWQGIGMEGQRCTCWAIFWWRTQQASLMCHNCLAKGSGRACTYAKCSGGSSEEQGR